jgi:hypothetical protein
VIGLIETRGETALGTWEQPEAAGAGSPVVLGDYARYPDGFDTLLAPFSCPVGYTPSRSVDDILKAADRLRFPEDLARRKAAEREAILGGSKGALALNPDMAIPTVIEASGGQVRRRSDGP